MKIGCLALKTRIVKVNGPSHGQTQVSLKLGCNQLKILGPSIESVLQNKYILLEIPGEFVDKFKTSKFLEVSLYFNRIASGAFW